jgi:hypothetical protein
VKDKRKGPIGRAAGLAEGVAATVRRMQREREPRVLVYDETGYARLVQPNGRGYERLQDTAERMVALVDEAEAAAKPRRARPIEVAGQANPLTTKRPGAAKPRDTARTKAAKAKQGGAKAKQRGAKAKPGGAKRADGAKRAGAAKPRRARSTGRAGGQGKPRRSPREGDG